MLVGEDGGSAHPVARENLPEGERGTPRVSKYNEPSCLLKFS